MQRLREHGIGGGSSSSVLNLSRRLDIEANVEAVSCGPCYFFLPLSPLLASVKKAVVASGGNVTEVLLPHDETFLFLELQT